MNRFGALASSTLAVALALGACSSGTVIGDPARGDAAVLDQRAGAAGPINPNDPQMPKVGDFCRYQKPALGTPDKPCWYNNTIGEQASFIVAVGNWPVDYQIVNDDGLRTPVKSLVIGQHDQVDIRPGDRVYLRGPDQGASAVNSLTVLSVN